MLILLAFMHVEWGYMLIYANSLEISYNLQVKLLKLKLSVKMKPSCFPESTHLLISCKVIQILLTSFNIDFSLKSSLFVNYSN